MADKRDYYEVLRRGSKSCRLTPTLKKAYRNVSQKVSPGCQIRVIKRRRLKFKEATEAYTSLK